MPDNTSDLWPELRATFRSPLTILKEQAALLSHKTKGLLQVEIVSKATPDGSKFIHNFIIISPSINYRYSLFFVRQPMLGYPALIYFASAPGHRDPRAEKLRPQPLSARDETQFLAKLKRVLNSEKTKALLNALLSQSSPL